ncbi:TPA: flap endonuclease-1 [Candidatus Woesearchaeota archaeon]|nr:flap endonuclease-1 [Candidatus Woesearchaeota archaeon]HIH55062.1 flap endonuclease-1 [Candidatus Woesearchaeota archaeon]HIJ14636.1 flap endonuclease-1 [Candidatus Woesearchaeota archaeon]
MGTKITELMQSKEISIDDLKGKTVVVDAFNQLYMFLSSIRQPDGSLLKDSKGNVTSHLNGLFYRFTKLMQHDIRFVFVFDGKPPELKLKERQRRAELKHEAELKFEEAKEKGDEEEMKKYAARTSKLSKDMINDAKELIDALGLCIVQAPSEGEAQAAFIVRNKHAYASLSQDADSLLFGCPLIVKNLTISGRRKQAGKLSYDTVIPEIISLHDTLKELDIAQDQLIVIAMLTGTDYNIGGIKGIGHKTALKLVKEYGSGEENFDKLFKDHKWSEYFDYDWIEVFDIIKNTETTDDYKIIFKEVNDEKVIDVLCNKHEFSEERVRKVLETLHSKPKSQKGLGEWS